MTEKSCRPAFSLPFHGLIVTRQIAFSDEVPDQFNLLPAVAAGLIRCMDDNFLYKLINDGGRQFTNAHIFPYNGCKAVKVGFILFKGFYRFPPCIVLELADGEIGGFVGMSRSAVQRHRTKTLSELRKNLESKGVKT